MSLHVPVHTQSLIQTNATYRSQLYFIFVFNKYKADLFFIHFTSFLLFLYITYIFYLSNRLVLIIIKLTKNTLAINYVFKMTDHLFEIQTDIVYISYKRVSTSFEWMNTKCVCVVQFSKLSNTIRVTNDLECNSKYNKTALAVNVLIVIDSEVTQN